MLACANVVMMATASAPSPIYPLYRERWGLSVTMLTVIFAVYVVGLLGALLTVGSLSDQLGRRPVLVAALLVAVSSTAVFWTADGVVSLLIARVVQGIATGRPRAVLPPDWSSSHPKDVRSWGPRRQRWARVSAWPPAPEWWAAASVDLRPRCVCLSRPYAGLRRSGRGRPHDP
ncbi:MFS transporter [Streptomyces sp. NPDC001153]